jgi:hypothetical protein
MSQSMYFFNFYLKKIHIKILVKLNPKKKGKLVEFTVQKQKNSKFSQFICGKIAKFCQKKRKKKKH